MTTAVIGLHEAPSSPISSVQPFCSKVLRPMHSSGNQEEQSLHNTEGRPNPSSRAVRSCKLGRPVSSSSSSAASSEALRLIGAPGSQAQRRTCRQEWVPSKAAISCPFVSASPRIFRTSGANGNDVGQRLRKPRTRSDPRRYALACLNLASSHVG
jgi:hypothetical protein